MFVLAPTRAAVNPRLRVELELEAEAEPEPDPAAGTQQLLTASCNS